MGSGRRVSLLKQAPQSEETVLANMLVEKLVSSKWTSLHEVIIKTRDGIIQVRLSHMILCMCILFARLAGILL